MSNTMIIMPNGDVVLASQITSVGLSLSGTKPTRTGSPVAWSATVKIGGVEAYVVDDDEIAVAERDRILAEWTAKRPFTREAFRDICITAVCAKHENSAVRVAALQVLERALLFAPGGRNEEERRLYDKAVAGLTRPLSRPPE